MDRPSDGSRLEREDLIRFALEALGLERSASVEVSALDVRGSDRTFYRMRTREGQTAVLVHYDPNRIENTYYFEAASFLREKEIAVPRVFGHDKERCLIVMEDLGDQDLWYFRKAPWEIREPLYKKTLNVAQRLHRIRKDDVPSQRVRVMEAFGPSLYRWERDYFKQYFVKSICGIELDVPFQQELEQELSDLAEKLCEREGVLIHRDLQSQNVMVRGEEVFLIDFQGMRFGNPLYDLGSLLCDPYVEFSDSEREELLAFYYSSSGGGSSWLHFSKAFWEASAQRLMQALGAYGFLAKKKGLSAFLQHVPPGLSRLGQASSAASLSCLHALCRRCQRRWEELGKRR